MFRVQVVYTAAGHRPQVWADLQLSDRYNVLIWEGEPVETPDEAHTTANQHIEEAVRRLFWDGNVGQEAKKSDAQRPMVRDAPQA